MGVMELPKGSILSEDGQFVLGNSITGKTYVRKIPVGRFANLRKGRTRADIEQSATVVEARYKKYLAGLEKGMQRSAAAKAAGWADVSVVRNRRKADPAFAQAEIDAEETAAEAVADVVWKEIVENGNAVLGIKWLEKNSDKWKDRKEVVETHRLEIDASDRVAAIAELVNRLGERKALSEGKVIDVD